MVYWMVEKCSDVVDEDWVEEWSYVFLVCEGERAFEGNPSGDTLAQVFDGKVYGF